MAKNNFTDNPQDSDDVGDLLNSVPGCFIVSSEQFKGMLSFASLLARQGIMRRVFLKSEIDAAKKWAALVVSREQEIARLESK